MKVQSTKHTNSQRSHIPSKEEAGYEDANDKVQNGSNKIEIPKNPIVHRGKDPELFWLNKYGNDDREDALSIDIRSLYRHEHVAPETLIQNLYKIKESDQKELFDTNELFGNALEKDELDKISEYYQHKNGWTNRLIQGDSHLVMASLLEREGMAGQVQTIYIDPPYGIKYGGNWQVKMGDRNVADGKDDALTAEPEQIKAFRDTWELGIHSYLSYLRDRLLIAKELLNKTGSCFVQISDENVHLVRNIMDEVFGSGNFVSLISFETTTSFSTKTLSSTSDYIIWYAKSVDDLKSRKLFMDKEIGSNYKWLELPNGTVRNVTKEEFLDKRLIPDGAKVFAIGDLRSSGWSQKGSFEFKFDGQVYRPSSNRHWSTTKEGMDNLAEKDRILKTGRSIMYKRYLDDFPVTEITNHWSDTKQSFSSSKVYVVQTNEKAIMKCLLMTSDPGDLVLDPTCGSGTTAYVAEQWGRRWITIDTSRIALNIAKQRLMTAVYPYYKLYDTQNEDIRHGFVYKTVPHITLKALANDEPPATETLYDQPEIDKKVLRVSGPFTVETLQNFEPTSPDELDNDRLKLETNENFEAVIKEHLLSAGIKNGRKNEQVVFRSVEVLSGEALHAEGFYITDKGEEKAYFHIGPKFGTVSRKLVNDSIKECRQRGDANWLIILGFSFESDIESGQYTKSVGTFEVTKVRIHDDLLQEGLKKKPAKSAASFVTIGEPDIDLKKDETGVFVEVKGLDIYDPIRDEVKARDLHDIAYWMVDDDYDGSSFIVRQIFFCGGDKDAFKNWRRGLDNLAKESTKKKLEATLKIEIDEEAFDRLYGYQSHPIEVKSPNQKIAIRIVSQFGEESTKIIDIGSIDSAT
ncbi:MAG: site-specific DNA-methyltransferase [Bernardetiaceae bacterium]|nr:site-specific DNA-methyltransferase [Bernardetiaceae bacterium]